MDKITKDFETIKSRFKNIDMVQVAVGRKIDLEVYYNESWAYINLGYDSESEMSKLVELIKKEYSI